MDPVFSTVLAYLDKGGVIALLALIIAAFWKGWVVRSTEYEKLVDLNRRLSEDNDALRSTLDQVVRGLAHPVRQTLEALPTPREGAP